MKKIIFYLSLIIWGNIFAQSGIINPSIYNKPLPNIINLPNQPTNFKFTSHIVNIKIPQNEIDKSIDVSDEMPDAEAGVGDLEIEWETLEEENNRELANRLPNDSTENLENAIEGKPLAVSETGELIESNEDNAKDGLDSQGDDQNTDNTETD